MGEALTKLLKTTFDIREGEGRRAFLMQLNIFLIISTLLIVKPTVNGLFLSEIGVLEQLPLAFLLLAVCAIFVSTLYSRFLGQSPLYQIILITLLSSVLLFVLFGFLLYFKAVGDWILYAFYIWVGIFGVLTASQFWILANVVFNVREAKRLFGFIGAGAIAGGIFGGYFTTLTAEWLGSELLPFVAAGLLCFCIPITSTIWKKNVLPSQSWFQRRKKIQVAEHPLKLIRRSPHLTSLAAIIGISVIVARLVDYQFNAISSDKIPDPDELTAFFGFWFSSFNVISLTVQLLLTRRLVGVLGVGTSLFFLPVSIFFGAVLLIFFPELWTVIIIKMSDGSLKQSVNKAAVELLALPVPSEIKNKTKTFIDVVVDSVATGIGGMILIFLINGLQVSNRFISIMILVLIVCWLYFILRVKKTYLNAFKLNIQNADAKDGEHIDLKNDSVLSDLRTILRSGSDEQILYVLSKCKSRPDSRLTEDLLLLLRHPSADVIEGAIQNLYFITNQHYVEEISAFADHESPKVKIAAFEYLIGHSPEDTNMLMERYLTDKDSIVRLSALISLAKESRNNPVLQEKFNLRHRLQRQYEELSDQSDEGQLVFQKIMFLKALGFAGMPEFFSYLESFFDDSDGAVVKQAILSAGETLHPHFLPFLIDFLGIPAISDHAVAALGKYGEEVVKVLSNYTHSPEAKPENLENIPVVVGQFGIQSSADLLFFLLQNDNALVRLAALRSLNRLKVRFSYLNYYEKEILPHLYNEAGIFQDILSILYVQRKATYSHPVEEADAKKQKARQHLIQLLEVRLDNNLERIFRLLGLKYPPEDVIQVFENIQNPQLDMRTNALEYLDNLLDPGLKKILIPIVETALLDTISEEVVRELKWKVPDEEECFRLLMEKGDEEVRLAVRQLS